MARRPRSQRQIERTRREILDAAASVLSRVGYKAATMEAIANEAGFSASSLYTYFRGKREILTELASTIEQEITELLQRPWPEGLTLEQRLELSLRYQLEWIERRRDAFVLFVSHGHEVVQYIDHEQKAPPPDAMGMAIDNFTKMFEQYAEPGDLGGSTPERAAVLLHSIVHGFFLQWLRLGGDSSLASQTRTILHYFFYGVRRGAGPD
jgi:AcrR family transcriptional regulator